MPLSHRDRMEFAVWRRLCADYGLTGSYPGPEARFGEANSSKILAFSLPRPPFLGTWEDAIRSLSSQDSHSTCTCSLEVVDGPGRQRIRHWHSHKVQRIHLGKSVMNLS